jgi:hypothetical protein
VRLKGCSYRNARYIAKDSSQALQRKRQMEGLSGRQINCEVATLRAILKRYKLWIPLAEDVKFLHEREDTGRALALDDEVRLLRRWHKALRRHFTRFSSFRLTRD